MQLKKYYLIECVLCFMRLPCISFVHTPCLPCICSFCSFALLFVRSPDLCSFNHQFAFSLFIHSFAFSLLVPFFFFFFHSLVSSLFLLPIRSFSLSFSLFQSPVRCLRSSLTRSFSPAFFGYLALLFKFLQSIFHCIFHPFFIIIINFISCHARVVPFSLGLLTCLFVRHSVAFWFPVPLPPSLQIGRASCRERV